MTLNYITLSLTGTTVLAGVGVFLLITLILVAILLVAKRFLVHSGDVAINVNNTKTFNAPAGASLLSTMATCDVFLPSACGDKG